MPITTMLLIAIVAASGPAEDWPHLRGPALDGRTVSSVFEQRDFALAQAWKLPLGSGYSGVVIADGTVFTMCSDGTSDVVVALDAERGHERWRHAVGPTYPGVDGADDGPMSTPLVHDDTVFALGPFGTLVALGRDDGSVRWSRDLVSELGAVKPEYGFATTPIADGDLVFVQVGAPGGRAIAALDVRTGDVRWSAGDEAVSYQSPAIMTLAGRRQLVAFRGDALVGHDPSTGDVLWEHALGPRDRSGTAIPTPVDEDRFAVVARSGLIVFAVHTPADPGGGYAVEPIVRSRHLGGGYAQAVQFGDHFYGFRGDFLTCVDARTGDRVWKSRPPGGSGLILVNDHLVVYGAHGRVVVVPATPDGYREAASLEVFEGSALTWPSFAGDRLFVRNARGIAAIDVVASADAHADAHTDAHAQTDAHTDAGGAFGRFLRSLVDVPDAAARVDRVDRFMAAPASFPMVEGNVVHFVYRGDVEDVAIAISTHDGSRPLPLARVSGTDLFYRTIALAPASRVEYVFQVDYERWEPDPLNPHTTPAQRGSAPASEVALPGYVRAAHLDEPTGARGRLESFEFRSAILDRERTIRVYLPHAYDDEASGPFPLLLVQDGEAWLDKGKLTNTLDHVCGATAEPVVVAFIPAIGPWWLEAGGSQTAEFVSMLADELVPELERRYRLAGAPGRRAIHGVRDYGLTAAYAAVRRPDVFGKAAVQSIGLRNGAQHELLRLVAARPPTDAVIYVDWNRYEERSVDRGDDFGADTRAFVAALADAGCTYVGGEANDAHGWGSWRARSDRVLECLFPADVP